MAKTRTQTAAAQDTEDVGLGLLAVAHAISGLETQPPSYFLDDTNAALNYLAQSVDKLATAMAVNALAAHGTDEDRQRAVDTLRRYFEEY
jgi:hypothetical protein